MFGLIIRPQSSDTTNRRISTLPVAGSTSTVAAWVAFDHMVAGAMERWTTSSSESSSGGSVADCWYAVFATCCTGTDFVGVPLTDTTPSATSRSSGDASSRCAAMATTFSRSRSDASVTAWPIIGPLRLPPVPGAERRAVGVALAHGDVVVVDPEVLGHELRGRRLESLAVRAGTDEHVDAPVGVHAHVGGLVGVRGDAGSAVPRRPRTRSPGTGPRRWRGPARRGTRRSRARRPPARGSPRA